MLDLMKTFDFDDQPVRVLLRAGEPWLVAADVCRVLDIANPRDAVSRLDEDEKGVGNADTPGGVQEMNIVSESGFYALVFTSRKPEAKAFRKWVTGTVLPALRKTGSFADPLHMNAAPERPPLDFMARQDVSNWLSMVREARLLRGPAAAAKLWQDSPLPRLPDDPAKPSQGLSHDFSVMEQFLTQCCRATGGKEDWLTRADLAQAFNIWRDRQGLALWSANSVTRAVLPFCDTWRHPDTGRGFRDHKRAGERGFSGLCLIGDLAD